MGCVVYWLCVCFCFCFCFFFVDVDDKYWELCLLEDVFGYVFEDDLGEIGVIV